MSCDYVLFDSVEDRGKCKGLSSPPAAMYRVAVLILTSIVSIDTEDGGAL